MADYQYKRDRIQKSHEECDCETCGEPLILGDHTVIPAKGDWVEVFCSPRCFQDWASWAFAPEPLTYGA